MQLKLRFTGFLILISSYGYCQLSILNANFNEYNITANSLSQISVNNIGASGLVKIEIVLTNSANVRLLSAVSLPVEVKQGLTVFGSHSLPFESISYGTTPQAQYVKTTHRLSSGGFNYCVRIIPLTIIETGDENCQSINVSEDYQLFLINPIDEDVIESSTPILMWMHTEPFNLLGEGEFFRMILVEVKTGQEPDEAILSNVPIFVKSYVAKHQVQYPLDADKLEKGKTYAWHVQKIANGAILSSSEVWSFSLEKLKATKHSYVIVKKKLDGTVHKVFDKKIYFRFDERYKTSASLVCAVYNGKRELIEPTLKNEHTSQVAIPSAGYNGYELDLKQYRLKKGFYTLEVSNEKKEKFLLKFYVD